MENWFEDIEVEELWRPIPNPVRPQSNNQPGISGGAVPNQISNVSTLQASQSPNISNGSLLERNERTQRKRKNDREYRERCKNRKVETESNLKNLGGENESLKKQNESLRKDNLLMNQTLRDQKEEIDQLRSDLCPLKRKHERQNVLAQTLSELLADPVRLENEKLKDETASLKKNANLNGYLAQLSEENARLRIENKVLKVQNDALCGKIISDNDKKREQEQEAKILC
ncbi:uncharacterized protein LOC111310884 isoform X2 [Durio zibethinus]|uniref:Uncharacterized protein LOC111310884 isoform X2 n=1 Tax=Durio zibethinus TaxID=66656 RepID=A0A6P6AM98_DURZI|nr:uncharacterized protein LOC111310884 isoform X2 [Durio zibethinus]